jgi:hypothetical protein
MNLGTGTEKFRRCQEADPVANRPVAFAQTLERTKDGLVLAIDGVPSASGHVVKADLIVGDTNGGQVSGDVHCSPAFWEHRNNVHLIEEFHYAGTSYPMVSVRDIKSGKVKATRSYSAPTEAHCCYHPNFR